MNFIYNFICKRTSTYAMGIVASAFFFERGFDIIAESIFNSHNKGKLWKDIEHKYKE